MYRKKTAGTAFFKYSNKHNVNHKKIWNNCIRLIVDDDRFNIKVLTHFLHDYYKIMAAKDGESAIKAALSVSPPDLIHLDIILPGID